MSTDNLNTASQMIKDMGSRESNEPPKVGSTVHDNSPNVQNPKNQDQKKINIRRT